jgi:hypothetical protein
MACLFARKERVDRVSGKTARNELGGSHSQAMTM